MAQYGLETETTVHIKGMQIGDSQPDTGLGVGDAYDKLANSIFFSPVRVYERAHSNGAYDFWVESPFPSIEPGSIILPKSSEAPMVFATLFEDSPYLAKMCSAVYFCIDPKDVPLDADIIVGSEDGAMCVIIDMM